MKKYVLEAGRKGEERFLPSTGLDPLLYKATKCRHEVSCAPCPLPSRPRLNLFTLCAKRALYYMSLFLGVMPTANQHLWCTQKLFSLLIFFFRAVFFFSRASVMNSPSVLPTPKFLKPPIPPPRRYPEAPYATRNGNPIKRPPPSRGHSASQQNLVLRPRPLLHHPSRACPPNSHPSSSTTT